MAQLGECIGWFASRQKSATLARIGERAEQNGDKKFAMQTYQAAADKEAEAITLFGATTNPRVRGSMVCNAVDLYIKAGNIVEAKDLIGVWRTSSLVSPDARNQLLSFETMLRCSSAGERTWG